METSYRPKPPAPLHPGQRLPPSWRRIVNPLPSLPNPESCQKSGPPNPQTNTSNLSSHPSLLPLSPTFFLLHPFSVISPSSSSLPPPLHPFSSSPPSSSSLPLHPSTPPSLLFPLPLLFLLSIPSLPPCLPLSSISPSSFLLLHLFSFLPLPPHHSIPLTLLHPCPSSMFPLPILLPRPPGSPAGPSGVVWCVLSTACVGGWP